MCREGEVPTEPASESETTPSEAPAVRREPHPPLRKQRLISVVLDGAASAHQFQVVVDHHTHEFIEAHRGGPPKFPARFASIS